MKKNKLIELLQKIDGNPDIYLWNGFVSDWMDISPEFVESELVKYSEDFILDHLKMDWCKDNNTFDIPSEVLSQLQEAALESAAKGKWEFPNRYVEESDYPRWYGKYQKRIILLGAKPKGATRSDRLGDINY